MKLCIPVESLDGLSACPQAAQPDIRYLHIIDLESRQSEEIDLMALEEEDSPVVAFDALACTSIARPVFRDLRQKGIQVFLTEAPSVQAALEEFEQGEMFLIPDSAAAACGGGGCSGHGEGQGGGCHGSGGGCGGGHGGGEGGGCGGHGHEDGHEHGEGGCACAGHGHDDGNVAVVARPLGETFKIAVTSQNRKTVTEHAGKCRKFWVYEIKAGAVVGKQLLELSKDQSLHETAPGEAHPLDEVSVLLTTGFGAGLQQRLARKGIEAMMTEEKTPDAAVEAFMKQLA